MRMISSARVLFLALVTFFLVGGGTAVASYVVSTNAQIGPNTVSGHHPPTGEHANLIAGSVNGTDIAAPARLPAGCSSTQIARWTGSKWACANGSFWSTSGNSGTTSSNFLGTTDDKSLNLDVNGARALRLEPTSSYPNLIGGFNGNSVSAGAVGATIAGGGGASGAANKVTDDFGAVGGGRHNVAGDNAGTASDRPFATVAGGLVNTAKGQGSAVGGGEFNTASGNAAAVGGGSGNAASGPRAAVLGGNSNIASGSGAAVGGGYNSTVSGLDAAVPGGASNTASGVASLAAGVSAHATHDGSFVWGDDSSGSTTDTGLNSFVARASGGFTLYTAAGSSTATGATLAAGSGSWSSLSDRHAKDHISRVSAQSVLAKLRTLPIRTWSYKAQGGGVRHLGPMAQAFNRRFGLGESSRYIDDVDAQGVSLAAIKGLDSKVRGQRARLRSQGARVRSLRSRVRSQGHRVTALSRAVRRLEQR
jgi:hypothetical protein